MHVNVGRALEKKKGQNFPGKIIKHFLGKELMISRERGREEGREQGGRKRISLSLENFQKRGDSYGDREMLYQLQIFQYLHSFFLSYTCPILQIFIIIFFFNKLASSRKRASCQFRLAASNSNSFISLKSPSFIFKYYITKHQLLIKRFRLSPVYPKLHTRISSLYVCIFFDKLFIASEDKFLKKHNITELKLKKPLLKIIDFTRLIIVKFSPNSILESD